MHGLQSPHKGLKEEILNMDKMSARLSALKELAPDGRPLFENPTQLARAVVAVQGQPGQPDHSGYADMASLGSTMNQIFRGSRKCPDQLLSVILKAVDQRMAGADEYRRNEVQSQFKEVLTRHVDAQSVVPRCAPQDFNKVLAEARRSRSLVGVLQPDAVDDPCGRRVLDALLERLDLPGAQEPKVTFLFPSEEIAKTFWLGLLDHISSGHNIEVSLDAAKARLRALNESGLLVVKAVSEKDCLQKGLFFDAEDGGGSPAFHLYFKQGVPFLCSIPDEEASAWRRQVYLPIKLKTAPSVDVAFGDAVPEPELVG